MEERWHLSDQYFSD
jgi:hypothetical protein